MVTTKLTTSPSPSPSPSPESRPRKVIIDTDVGLDDAQAILLTLADPSVEVIAITCVGGNASLDNVCINTLKVLTIAGRLDVPVYRGCKEPIIGNENPGIIFHGEDGLGDCDPSVLSVAVDVGMIQEEHATSALIRLAKLYSGQVTVVCLAPLTNLAVAIRIEPNFTQLLKSIHIMGGNHAGEGNETASAEFNFHHDPEAASIVLSTANCEVVMLGWEVCALPSSRFDLEWMDEFFAQTTPQGQFIQKIQAGALARAHQNKEPSNAGVVMCDEWLAAIFLDPEICTLSRKWPTVVELSGRLTRGQCVVDKRFYCNKAQGRSNVRHVLHLDIERMKERLMGMARSTAFSGPL